jgi:HK97 family phage prohead protease
MLSPMTLIEQRQPRDDFGRFASTGGAGGGGAASGGDGGDGAQREVLRDNVIRGDKEGASTGTNASDYDQETGTSEDALEHTEKAIIKADRLIDDELESGQEHSASDKALLNNARDSLQGADIARDEINDQDSRAEPTNSTNFNKARNGVINVGQSLTDRGEAESVKNLGKLISKIGKNMPAGIPSNPAYGRSGWVAVGAEKRRVAFAYTEWRTVGEGNTIRGYAAIFDSPSEPLPWVEMVRRGAFAKTLNDGADVRLLVDHEGIPLARTKSGTLALEEDERGLRVEAELDPANPDAAKVMSAMRRGDLNQMSFAFRTIKDSWSNDRQTRELREVQLYDVSVVTFPAYEETVAELRSRNQPATVQTANNLLLRRNQLAIARTRQPGRSR